jgi:RNA polymerase sigma-70 factor (ECF subfamily)
MIVAAGRKSSPESAVALAELCQSYWYPLYAFVRQQGHSADDAQDFTQGFFARLLEKNYLDDVDRQRGRFRSFLLVALKHFISNERDRARAQKRGGGASTVDWDAADAEARYRAEPATNLTPEKLFDRQWALSVLDRTLARLEADYRAAGKIAIFEVLKPSLAGDGELKSHAELGERLAMSPGAVKVAVHRLRRRYRDLLRSEIAQTVADTDDVEAELRDLLAALG